MTGRYSFYLRGNLHENVPDIEDTEGRRKLLTLELKVGLESPKAGGRRIIPVDLSKTISSADAEKTRCHTYIVQDVDDNQDGHAKVELAEELAFKLRALFSPSELLIAVDDRYAVLGELEVLLLDSGRDRCCLLSHGRGEGRGRDSEGVRDKRP